MPFKRLPTPVLSNLLLFRYRFNKESDTNSDKCNQIVVSPSFLI